MITGERVAQVTRQILLKMSQPMTIPIVIWIDLGSMAKSRLPKDVQMTDGHKHVQVGKTGATRLPDFQNWTLQDSYLIFEALITDSLMQFRFRSFFFFFSGAVVIVRHLPNAQ